MPVSSSSDCGTFHFGLPNRFDCIAHASRSSVVISHFAFTCTKNMNSESTNKQTNTWTDSFEVAIFLSCSRSIFLSYDEVDSEDFEERFFGCWKVCGNFWDVQRRSLFSAGLSAVDWWMALKRSLCFFIWIALYESLHMNRFKWVSRLNYYRNVKQFHRLD